MECVCTSERGTARWPRPGDLCAECMMRIPRSLPSSSRRWARARIYFYQRFGARRRRAPRGWVEAEGSVGRVSGETHLQIPSDRQRVLGVSPSACSETLKKKKPALGPSESNSPPPDRPPINTQRRPDPTALAPLSRSRSLDGSVGPRTRVMAGAVGVMLSDCAISNN